MKSYFAFDAVVCLHVYHFFECAKSSDRKNNEPREPFGTRHSHKAEAGEVFPLQQLGDS
jgi:hypothetical protein